MKAKKGTLVVGKVLKKTKCGSVCAVVCAAPHIKQMKRFYRLPLPFCLETRSGGLPLSADMAHCSPWTNKELYWFHYTFGASSDGLLTSLNDESHFRFQQ